MTGSTVSGNDGVGIDLDDVAGHSSTIEETTVSDNGDRGIYLRSTSNVTIRNSVVEGHGKRGIQIFGFSRDNTIVGTTVGGHRNASANATGYGIRVSASDAGIPANNTINASTIEDNDVGVGFLDDSGSELRHSQLLGNGEGIRFGASTIPYRIDLAYDCDGDGQADGSKSDYRSGSAAGTIVNNRIEGGDTALHAVTHPTTVVRCDGSVETVSNSRPSVDDYRIANNYLDASELVNVSTFHGSQLNGSNAWNFSGATDGNVLGGPRLAGNYWAKPDGTGFSQTCDDADDDGVCDSARQISSNNVDALPLARGQPAYFVVDVLSTNAPVTEGEQLSVEASVENTGGAKDTQEIVLTVNGTDRDAETVTLDEGSLASATTLTLTWTTGAGDAGDHIATVASDADSDAAAVTVEAATETPTPTPSPSPTPSPTPTASPTPTPSPTPSPTASPSPTPTASPSPTATETASPTATPVQTTRGAGPGFGAIGVLLALLALVALARTAGE